MLKERIHTSPLKKISVIGGDVLHAIKKNDSGFVAFGEVYFSWINPGIIKGWKYHLRMTLNLIVPVGEVKFVFHDPINGEFFENIIGEKNYNRITVPPKIWFGFQGMSTDSSLLLNLSDIEHDSKEVKNKKINAIDYCWNL